MCRLCNGHFFLEFLWILSIYRVSSGQENDSEANETKLQLEIKNSR